jgi:secondary thiamine-phosphate synthase enzyme
MRTHHHIACIATQQGLNIHNLMDEIRSQIAHSEIQNGFVIVSSRHTTTGITINEDEKRLHSDIESFFAKLAPESDKYLHNDIHLRDCPQDEPENAHSHLIAMLLGSSESIPLIDGELALGQWQSVMMLELDGPRTRSVTIQIIGE